MTWGEVTLFSCQCTGKEGVDAVCNSARVKEWKGEKAKPALQIHPPDLGVARLEDLIDDS
jgi:hypothetical protein